MRERQAAFVRNVMIGREGLHRGILFELFAKAGAETPRSYISTGNVSFTAPSADLAAITCHVEKGLAQVIGRREEVFVRSIDYLQGLVASDPFADSPFRNPVERNVSFALAPIDPAALDLPVQSSRGDVSLFAATPAEVFCVARLVDGRTSGSGGLVESTLAQRVTTRSWSTILRITDSPT